MNSSDKTVLGFSLVGGLILLSIVLFMLFSSDGTTHVEPETQVAYEQKVEVVRKNTEPPVPKQITPKPIVRQSTNEPTITEPVATDFRNTAWGMSREAVLASEKSELFLDEKDVLIFSGKLGNFDCKIAYVFANDQLVRSKYIIFSDYVNENRNIMEYSAVNKMLTNKYGVPQESNVIWTNDLYKDDYSKWGMSVSVGYTHMFDNWDVGKTRIVHALSGENFEIMHVIEYISKELEHIENKIKADAVNRDL